MQKSDMYVHHGTLHVCIPRLNDQEHMLEYRNVGIERLATHPWNKDPATAHIPFAANAFAIHRAHDWITRIQKQLRVSPVKCILITGEGIAGAIAIVVACQLLLEKKYNKFIIHLCTLDSPRVLSEETASHIEKNLSGQFSNFAVQRKVTVTKNSNNTSWPVVTLSSGVRFAVVPLSCQPGKDYFISGGEYKGLGEIVLPEYIQTTHKDQCLLREMLDNCETSSATVLTYLEKAN